ncbi:hypothetical protein HP548_00675 [Paenibacillus taichungensis]|uniref:TRASH domain-containing protein n=1 Tax=Paenibacillus taichungensis TaxID=484184 RepID=A0ABX2MDM7_9BACL|nr:hypothetical protein [Paenibacillus taichungensis]NUU52624.1 hypothetical protein [Paenibacillus taichungensis]
MTEVKKESMRRALRAQLLQTYNKMLDSNDVEKQADYRLKTFRIQKLLKRVENPVDDREYTTQGMTVGHCMNCEVPISRYDIHAVKRKKIMFCCDGCQKHYDEMCGHRKAAASRERNRLSNSYFNSYNVIIPNQKPLGKRGGQEAVYGA